MGHSRHILVDMQVLRHRNAHLGLYSRLATTVPTHLAVQSPSIMQFILMNEVTGSLVKTLRYYDFVTHEPKALSLWENPYCFTRYNDVYRDIPKERWSQFDKLTTNLQVCPTTHETSRSIWLLQNDILIAWRRGGWGCGNSLSVIMVLSIQGTPFR